MKDSDTHNALPQQQPSAESLAPNFEHLFQQGGEARRVRAGDQEVEQVLDKAKISSRIRSTSCSACARSGVRTWRLGDSIDNAAKLLVEERRATVSVVKERAHLRQEIASLSRRAETDQQVQIRTARAVRLFLDALDRRSYGREVRELWDAASSQASGS